MTAARSIGMETSEIRGAVRNLKILSLSCLYPNPAQPGQGLFVQRRLQHLAEMAEVRIVSPFAIAQYSNPKGRRFRIAKSWCPAERREGNVAVAHPRWFYPPFSGSAVPFWLSAQVLHTLSRIRREFPFAVLDTHFGFPDGVAGWLLSSALGVPFTMTFRGNEMKHSRSRMGRLLMARAARQASRVFAVSERLRQFAIALGAPPGRVKTIPNGVDAEVFFPRDRQECRLKYGLPADAPLLLSAGALVERKGHHRILEVLRDLAPAQLVVAGGPGPEGQYEEQLRRLTAHYGLERSVRFVGAVPPVALAELMSAADVFCLASTNEGWPNVVHEALACGTPVVATDVGAIPDMLTAGRTGIIVPVNDAARLQHALKNALRIEWDRNAISEWGRARSWRQVAAEIYEEMQAVLAEAG